MSNNKPREFWIDDLNGYVYRNGIDACINEIHVIEHSAYQAALDEIEALKEQVSDCAALYENSRNQRKEIIELKAKCERYEEALNRIVGMSNVVANTATEIYASGIARQALEIK